MSPDTTALYNQNPNDVFDTIKSKERCKRTSEELESYVNRPVSIITADGRNFVGTPKGFDQTINLTLDKTRERILSATQGVEQVVLGLHIIRGDNTCVNGEPKTPTPGHPQKRPLTSVGVQTPQLSQRTDPPRGRIPGAGGATHGAISKTARGFRKTEETQRKTVDPSTNQSTTGLNTILKTINHQTPGRRSMAASPADPAPPADHVSTSPADQRPRATMTRSSPIRKTRGRPSRQETKAKMRRATPTSGQTRQQNQSLRRRRPWT